MTSNRDADNGLPAAFLKLCNAEEDRRKDPRSFSIPRREQRQNCQPGCRVRLQYRGYYEQFRCELAAHAWVEIVLAQGGQYRGVIDETDALLSAYEGLKVEFGPEHICAIVLPEEFVLPYDDEVRVSKRVFEEDQWPALLVKQNPETEDDTGWRIVAKFEDPSAACVVVTGGRLIQKFQVLDSVLDEEALARWNWNEQELEYQRVC